MNFFHRHKGTPSRKYVDLLKESSAKWANWDPPKPIRVGDFGTLDYNSGELVCEGNLYDDEVFAPTSKSFPPQPGQAPDELMVIKSYHARGNEQKAGAKAGAVAGAASSDLSVEVRFAKKRGALLVMHRVKMEFLPDELLNRLHGCARLKGKQIVSEVYTCNGYALYLSSGESYTIALNLNGNVLAETLPISGGVTVMSAWHAEGTQGFLRQGYNREPVFAPLYGLKEFHSSIARRRDDAGEAEEVTAENGRWMDARVPWGELGEDGEEDEDSI